MGVTTAFVKWVEARLLWNLTRYLMKHFIMHLIMRDYYASDYFCNHKQEGVENLNFIFWFIVSRAQEKGVRNFVRQCCLLISCRNLYRDFSLELYLGKRLADMKILGESTSVIVMWVHGDLVLTPNPV